MTVALIIFAILLALAGLALLFVRDMLAPVAAFLSMVCVYYSSALPMNGTIILTWLCMTVVVMGVTMMQPPAVRIQHRGVGYILVGSLVGLAVGLMCYTFASTLSMLYGLMVVGVAVGAFLGFFLFTNTPGGKAVSLRSGRFFNYLLAKGFPVAITVMQLGVMAVLAMAISGEM